MFQRACTCRRDLRLLHERARAPALRRVSALGFLPASKPLAHQTLEPESLSSHLSILARKISWLKNVHRRVQGLSLFPRAPSFVPKPWFASCLFLFSLESRVASSDLNNSPAHR